MKRSLPSCISGEAPEVSSAKRVMHNEVRMETDKEYDDKKVEARLKQISYGKNTVGYDNYIAAVPK
jgi:hypothetical protein